MFAFSFVQVSTFGFGADQYGNWYHYFEKTSNKVRTGAHSGSFEFDTMTQLYLENKMIVFRGRYRCIEAWRAKLLKIPRGLRHYESAYLAVRQCICFLQLCIYEYFEKDSSRNK